MARAAVDYDNMPVVELQTTVRQKLSDLLNKDYTEPHSPVITKCWVKLAEYRGFTDADINYFRTENPAHPTQVMLHNWDKYADKNEPGTMEEFLDYTTKLGLCCDNLHEDFLTSYGGWNKRNRKGPTQSPEVSSTAYEECLVIGDEPGRPKQFHTTIVYCSHNTGISWEITQLLEQNGIKVLFMDRDLLLGGDKCTMMARSIKLRSKTILFIASQQSINDPVCDFIIKFANYLAPGGRSVIVLKLQRDLDFSNKETLQSLTKAEWADRDKDYFWPLLTESILKAPARMPLSEDDHRVSVPPVPRRHISAQDDQPDAGHGPVQDNQPFEMMNVP